MVKKVLPPEKAPGRDEGFSLVSVLIIMGVVLLAVMVISQARVNNQSAQKAIKLKQSYSDVNQALISDIVALVHGSLTATAPCINVSSINVNMNGINVANPASPAYVYANSLPLAAGSPVTHTDAQKRCARPRLPSNGTNDNDNRAYFCVRLGKDTSAPKDSILNADLAFAEISLELIDLQTQKPISCSNYVSKKNDPKDGSAGMAVTMALYWQAKIGTRTSFSQKALSYIANQN